MYFLVPPNIAYRSVCPRRNLGLITDYDNYHRQTNICTHTVTAHQTFKPAAINTVALLIL